jgi:hypothetical protein
LTCFAPPGPGGQSVNTTDSAVRITHLPTGIVVSCQNEKSQLQNKAAALRVLQSRLLERARQEREAQQCTQGDGGNSWGSQMRSYVPAPHQMVKDLRSTRSLRRTPCSTATSTASSSPASLAQNARVGRQLIHASPDCSAPPARSRSEPAYFVIARIRRACLLALPQLRRRAIRCLSSALIQMTG